MTIMPSSSKAVILAAGFGTRLRPLTDLRPKPLVEVNGVSILHNALRNLQRIGVRDVTIVVGYRKDAIEYACDHHFEGIDLHYVESAVFDHTGSAYSLWLARDTLLSGGCYILEGDVFFELDALEALRDAPFRDAIDVAPFDERMEGSAVVLSENGLISEVRMKQTSIDLFRPGAPDLYKTMNLMRFSHDTLRTLIVPMLDDLIGSGAHKAYTEELLSLLISNHGLKLGATRCDALRWYEIDSKEDLQIAEALFRDKPALALSQAV